MPIWAEFMKKAHQHREYRNVSQFSIPAGIVSAQIDNSSGQLATGSCPTKDIRTEYYLDGTAPTQFCPLHAGGTAVTDWQSPLPNVPPTGLPPSAQMTPPPPLQPAAAEDPADASQKDKPKKGVFDKLKSVFHK